MVSYGSDTSQSRSGKEMSSAAQASEMTPEQIAANIKEIARRIREESAKMKATVSTIRKSGAIEELSSAVREAALAARDTSKEINETARTLEERGFIRDTAAALNETSQVVKDTAGTLKRTSQDASQAGH